jgi:hypothetical protein
VLGALEYFLPEVLGELYKEWQGESLDGFYPRVFRKTGTNEIELFGLCILISDQTLAPIHLSMQLDLHKDEVSWLLLKIGEKLTGEPGETGKRGMKRLPYSCLEKAKSRVYRLSGNPDQIDWVYKVTYGEKH